MDSCKHGEPGDTPLGQFLKLDRDRLPDGWREITLGIGQARAAGELNPIRECDEQRP